MAKGPSYGRAVAVCGVAVLASIQPIMATAEMVRGKWTRSEGVRAELDAGLWLAGKAPPETTVLFDAYSYVPSRFRNVYRIAGHNYLLANHFEPDVLVTRDAVASDFSDTTDASLARVGRKTFLDAHYFYEYLKKDLIPEYTLARDFGSVQVYFRRLPKTDRNPDVGAQWVGLLNDARKSRLYRMVRAHWIMGDLHSAQGRTDLAEWMYGRAKQKHNYAPRLLRWASGEVAAGREEAAGTALLEVADWLLRQTPESRDAVRRGLQSDLETLRRAGGQSSAAQQVLTAIGAAEAPL